MPFLPTDLGRAKALAELLCAASAADDDVDADELDAVRTELTRLLGKLPPEVEQHARSFKWRGFDLQAVMTRLAPSGLDEKRDVLRAVRAVIKADGALREVETVFFERVANILRIPTSDIG
jgi:uncharacterized tellurite resistance protein B-like protein